GRRGLLCRRRGRLRDLRRDERLGESPYGGAGHGRSRQPHELSSIHGNLLMVLDWDSNLFRGASPLGLPYTRSRAPLRRRAPCAWLASLRSLASRRSLAPGASGEYLADLAQRPAERVQFLARVVERERRPGGRRNPEALHDGLRAVVPGPDRHALAIHDRADVLGVDAVHDERKDARLLPRRTQHPHPVEQLQYG